MLNASRKVTIIRLWDSKHLQQSKCIVYDKESHFQIKKSQMSKAVLKKNIAKKTGQILDKIPMENRA